MFETNASTSVRRPILMVVVGRQRVGKTTVVNTIIQKVRDGGGDLKTWNADVNNTSYNLGMFYDDVLSPGSSNAHDVRTWLEMRLQDQILRRYDTVLDVGGGDTPFTKLIEELPFIEELEADGILVVVVHVVGPEQADVDYLQAFASAGVLEAKATLILLNGGLVMGGKSIAPAFKGIMEHPAIVAATVKGAKVLTFPPLSCMSEVTDRKLTFREAAIGVVKDGMPPMMRFDRTRVRLWFDKSVPEFMAKIPPLWLPETMPAPAHVADAGEPELGFAAE